MSLVRPHAGKNIEQLEARHMLSAALASSVSAAVGADGTLVVIGSDAADVIRVSAVGDKIRVVGNGADLGTFGGGSFGGVTAVRVEGGGGDDSLIVSPGVTTPVTLVGGAGDDTLVASGTAATLIGGAGTDAMWAGNKSKVTVADAAGVETKRGVNRLPAVFSSVNVSTPTTGRAVGGFLSDLGKTVSKVAGNVADAASGAGKAVAAAGKGVGDNASAEVRGTLREPKLTELAWTRGDFTGLPLFSVDGPSAADVSQGRLNDCYVLSALASVAQADPSRIRQMITDLGDGTFAVKLMRGTAARYYRVDADLPITVGTTDQLAYAQLGQGSSLWVALVEKAFALDQGGTYKGLDKGGWMKGVYAAMGIAARTVVLSSGPVGILGLLAAELLAGKAATLATKELLRADSPLAENHAYTVVGVTFDSFGKPVSVTLRNPVTLAGVNGDGYVTIAARAVTMALSGVVVATV